MADAPYYGTPRDDADFNTMVRALGLAFGSDDEGVRKWLDVAGHQNMRVLADDRGVIACLGVNDLGQYFGGREVASGGVFGVATLPERRGEGAADRIMAALLRECRDRNQPISTLYPATHYFYRRLGYERAGDRWEVAMTPADIDVRERPLAMRPLTEADHDAVEALYEQTAATIDGHLRRTPYIWARVRSPKSNPTVGYAACRDDRIEGYVHYRTTRDEHFFLDMTVHDVCATTPDAAKSIMRFLADHRSTCRRLTLHLAPADPLIAILGEHRHDVRLRDYWMLRIVDPVAAIEARGWPAGASGRLDIRIRTDRIFDDNVGDYRIEAGEGRATCARLDAPSADAFELSERGLAAMYAGHAAPRDLLLTGHAAASDSALAAAERLFIPGRPWMRDMF